MLRKIASFLSLLLLSQVLHARPLWIATLPPVCALLHEVAGDAAEVRCLLPAGASPHDHQLTPQEARELYQADWVVAVGPELEHFVASWHQNHPKKAMLFLSESPDVQALPLRTRCNHTEHHGHDHHAVEGLWDPHLWLSPEQASQMVSAMAKQLPGLEPQRVLALQERLRELQEDLKKRFAPYQDTEYVVFHDAYQYFEHSMGLQGGHVLRDAPEGPWTVREMREAQQWLQNPEIRAVFIEPQFDMSVLQRLKNPYQIPILVLDPVGTNNTRYEAFVLELAQRFLDGLQQQPIKPPKTQP